MNHADLLSDAILNLKAPASIAAKAIVEKLRREGRTIIDFTLGEPDLDSPDHVKAAGIEAIQENQTHYTSSNGILPLREAVRRKLQLKNNLSYSNDQIVIGAGAKQLISAAMAATINADDEVIVPAPYWVSYPDLAQLHGGQARIVSCPTESGFKITTEQLEAAITPKTKLFLLNSPNNPSGAVYSREELEDLAVVLKQHPHVLIMADEIYEHFIFGDEEHVSMACLNAEMKDRTLIVSGVSKSYAMTGWRIGYAAGPDFLIKAMTKYISQTTTCPSSISQVAAVAALDGDQSCLDEFVNIYSKRGNRMADLLNEIGGISCPDPAGAFYLFPSVAGLIGKKTGQGKVLENDLDVSLYLLEAAGVAVLAGSAYGLSPYLRFSFAVSVEIIEEGCEQIRKACDELS